MVKLCNILHVLQNIRIYHVYIFFIHLCYVYLEKIVKWCIIYIFSFGLGNIENALQKIRRFVCYKSAFLEAFIEEGLKFTTSLYLMLIWIRVLRFVFENPKEVNKQMANLPFFSKFHKVQTTVNYMDAFVISMCGLQIAVTPETPRVKWTLVELEDSETEEEPAVPKKKKKSKKKRAATE